MADQTPSNKPANSQPPAASSAPVAASAPGSTPASDAVTVKDHVALSETVDKLAKQVQASSDRAAAAEAEAKSLREQLAKQVQAPAAVAAQSFPRGKFDHMLQDEAELARRAAAGATAIDTRPIQAGHYVVAGHTAVRSLEHTFKPGEDFTGAAGDIDGLLKSGAIVESDD
jgi:hypothetical protein